MRSRGVTNFGAGHAAERSCGCDEVTGWTTVRSIVRTLAGDDSTHQHIKFVSYAPGVSNLLKAVGRQSRVRFETGDPSATCTRLPYPAESSGKTDLDASEKLKQLLASVSSSSSAGWLGRSDDGVGV